MFKTVIRMIFEHRQLLLPGRLSSRGRRFYELKYVRLKIVPKEHAILAGGVATLAASGGVQVTASIRSQGGLGAGAKGAD
jgi:hypothetical protein